MQVGAPEDRHQYKDHQLFDPLEHRLAEMNFDAIIGITLQLLAQGSFNRHDAGRRVGVVTLAGASNYLPLGRTLEQYLAYLVLCEALCLAGEQDLEHSQRLLCLFDLCEGLQDLIDCLRRPDICQMDRDTLSNLNFTDPQMAAVDRTLHWIASTNPLTRMKQALESHPLISFVVGLCLGLEVHIIGAALAEEVIRGWVAVAIGAFMVILALYAYFRD
jgi:hypothetical protein